MKAWVRRLLQPAQTSPTRRFNWTDKRSKKKQVASGFRIAAGMIAGFAVMVAVAGGLSQLTGDHPELTRGSVALSAATLTIAAIIMLGTANRWAPYVAGFFFGPAVLKIAGMLALWSDSDPFGVTSGLC